MYLYVLIYLIDYKTSIKNPRLVSLLYAVVIVGSYA